MVNSTIGFIGLGAMGGAIVNRLITANQDVHIWGRTPEKLSPWLDQGATMAPSPGALAEACDIVCLCVTDTAAVEAVVFASDGIAASEQPSLIIDHSTIHPLATRRIAADLQTRNASTWIDAPVSGGVKGATEGTLISMLGGQANDIKRARPLLELYTSRLTHMGAIGAGQATKVVNQMLIGGNIAVLAEALNYAANFGVSAPSIPDALTDGWADSRVLQVHGRRMAEGNYAQELDAGIMLKDIDIAVDMGKQTDSAMPITNMVQQMYQQAIADGHADKGQSSLMCLYEDKKR